MQNGRRDSTGACALEQFANALFLQDAFSAHPVAMSSTVLVRQKSPFRLGPLWGDGVGFDVAGQHVELVSGLPDRD
ncbi:hypothetical protein [Bifidobacterium callitrichos]|uniref:hypothetical protein n=1 Tax=Bifidobacterium callitrichos TaxID=762209 RepID=UPI0005BC7D6D|nr:hypothetical protein [Bifidobacterium callitrichos]